MLFNSYEFIFLFLPVTFIGYFFFNSMRLAQVSRAFLILASLFFYSWWNINYLPIILTSMIFNFAIGSSFSRDQRHIKIHPKALLWVGIVSNIALLAYFKYSDFIIVNVNTLFNSQYPLLELSLPLALSFFTFQQIAYLVDSYKGETAEYDFLNYSIFVAFFPQLIAGPIVHHKEMMPQFSKTRNKVKCYRNIALGLYIFSIGLFKKIVVADTFSCWANAGFEKTNDLSFFEAWATSLSYTFQLYFDFSGYTDMAVGAALLFNIYLPINFNSPYKAKNIQDFWRRWHITLSRFLKDYLYIPLGGNRINRFRTYINLLVTFILGGLWHGAGWTFIFWGAMHGVAMVIFHIWRLTGLKLWGWLGWIITFNFVNVAWIFFRAENFTDAINLLKAMFISDSSKFKLSIYFWDKLSMWSDIPLYKYLPYEIDKPRVEETSILVIAIFIVVVLSFKNSNYYLQNKSISFKMLLLGTFAFSCSIISSFYTSTEVFLYFNF